MANNPPGGGYPPGGGPPGPYGQQPGQPQGGPQGQYGQPPGQPMGPPPGQYGQPPPGQPMGPPPGQYGQPPPGQPMGGPPPGQYGQPPPGQYGQPMGGPPMGGMPGQPPMGGMPGQPPMGGMPGQPPMGGMPGQPPMGGMPGQPPMGMPGQPMGMGGMPIRAFGGNVSGGSGGFNKMKIIGGAVLGVLIAIGAIIGVVWSMTHDTLHIINTTGRDGVSVFIDGVAVAANLKNAATESWLASESESVKSGSHKIEAKDATGKVIESFTVNFEGGSNGYLYAPMHSKDVCFVIQTDVYGRVIGNGPKDIVLDRGKNFWPMPSSIDRWFQDTPDQVKLGKGQSSTTKRAVRQVSCGG